MDTIRTVIKLSDAALVKEKLLVIVERSMSATSLPVVLALHLKHNTIFSSRPNNNLLDLGTDFAMSLYRWRSIIILHHGIIVIGAHVPCLAPCSRNGSNNGRHGVISPSTKLCHV
jgi:hypothetical protein